MSIIAIHGKMFSGKDTAGVMIKELSSKKWAIKKFGYKLKQIASILTGIPVDKFEDQEFKKTILGEEWGYEFTTDHTLIVDGKPKHSKHIVYMRVRDMLQKLGTEAIRYGLHPDAWINALMCDYKKIKNEDEEYEYPNWIITDLRFPNEYEAVKKRGGICIKIIRSDDQDLQPHISETSLNNYTFDYILHNDGDLIHLKQKVEEMLQQLNLK